MKKNIIIGVAIALAFIFNGWFWHTHFIQSPIKKIEFQCVICKGRIIPDTTVPKKPIVVPLVKAKELKTTSTPLTEEQIVRRANYGDILWNIYMLETTRGKNDGCRREGKWGGFGVMSNGSPACYDTFKQAVERASYWYGKIREGNTLDESLCIWNLGTKVSSCHYSRNYHTL